MKKQKAAKESILAVVIGLPVFLAAWIISFFVNIYNPKYVFNDDFVKLPVQTAAPTAAETPVPTPSPQPGPTGTATPEPTPSPSPEPSPEAGQNDSILNILLLGLDASTERYETMRSFRTDTIMLLAVNFDKERIDIISIPRDSYVNVYVPPDRRQSYDNLAYKNTRVNEAFAIGGGFKGGGFDNVMRTVSDLFGGITINYYAAVDMNVVKQIIDIMGGLYYDVDITVKMNGRTVEKGYRKLSGQEVLDYSRIRKGYGGDLGRIDRQQRIVLEVVRQLQERKELTKIPEYYSAVSENVFTNLNVTQIAALALFANDLDLEADVLRHTLPTKSIPMVEGKSMLGVDERKANEMLSEVYGGGAYRVSNLP